ncbi:hypothetical protein KR032_006914 [Drosophila birchii]|nr:hypothetical protein KR032_006914 [Drosophila birchii]
MYAQHLRKWSLKTKKQRMPLILLIISYMLLLITGVSAAATATATAMQQQRQQQQLPAERLLWEGSAEESSYYIPLSLDNDGGSISISSGSSSSESGSNIDSNSNNILSRLLSRTSNSLSSRSNLKLEPATVFDAGSSAANQQQQQEQLQQHVAAVPQKKVPNTLINSQIYNNLLYNGLSSAAAAASATSSKMRRHIQPTQLPAPASSFSHPASNYSRRALQSYYIESFEVPEDEEQQRNPEQAARSRRDGQNQRRPNAHRKELQADKRENRRLRQQQRKEQRPNRNQEQTPRRKHQRKHRGRQRSDRYCSARDPAQLAYAAPTVFKGVFKSMSADRRLNFSASMKVVEVYKQQRGLQLPSLVRLQFTVRNNSGECDIYREKLRPRGVLRSGNDLQQATSIEYMVFAQQTNPGNFTILGQPMRASHSVMEAVKTAVSDNYAQNASITEIIAKPTNTTIEHGQELRIICRVSGKPPPKVTWFKDDKSINRKRNVYQFKHHKRRSELIVRSFNSSSDAGKYECRAKNKASKAIIRRRIMINSAPVHFRPDQDTDVPCPFTDFCFHGGTCRMIKDMNLFYCR